MQTSTQAFDVLIVGAGAAGLYTALCLPASLNVGLITKDTLAHSASDWAQGGIAAVIAPDDSVELHLQDTLRAGAGLCDYDAVKFLVETAADRIQSLIDLGVAFDRHDGNLSLTLEAAHSRRRVLHAADTTGRAIVAILAAQVLQRKNITVFDQTFVLELWLHPTTQHCQGVSLIQNGELHWISARAVILATGGGGQVFAQTTNPAVSTGDGVAIAWRAGAQLRDLEFVQFHPTALTQPGAPRFLISEAVRGEGAHLIDETGRRFAFDYHPAGELAPRDVVSRAIFSHLQKTGNPTGNVWLDLRPIPPDTIRHRFPNIIQMCQSWGVDVFQEPIPVAPAAHYWMGGVVTDVNGSTSIPGLYAVGEVASTGVHGANRLASNSLLECLVFGAQLAELEFPAPAAILAVTQASRLPAPQDLSQQLTQVAYLRHQLPQLVWQSAGICREQHCLAEAIAQVQAWQQDFAALPLSQVLRSQSPRQRVELPWLTIADLRLWGETYNLLDVAYLTLKSAYFRTESRGGHYRSDYPNIDPTWQVHTVVQGQAWSTVAVNSPPTSAT